MESSIGRVARMHDELDKHKYSRLQRVTMTLNHASVSEFNDSISFSPVIQRIVAYNNDYYPIVSPGFHQCQSPTVHERWLAIGQYVTCLHADGWLDATGVGTATGRPASHRTQRVVTTRSCQSEADCTAAAAAYVWQVSASLRWPWQWRVDPCL